MIELRSALDITAQIVRLKERVSGGVGAKNLDNVETTSRKLFVNPSSLKMMLDKQQ